MKIIILSLICLTLSACSSKSYKVVETLNDASKPSWANLEKVTWKEDGKVFALGFVEVEGFTANHSALARIADNNGKTEITKLISNDIGSSLQNTVNGTELSDQSSVYIGTEQSQVLMQELSTEKRYFEKVAYTISEDKVILKTQFYSLVSVSESTYKRFLELYRKEKLIEQVKEKSEAVSLTINE